MEIFRISVVILLSASIFYPSEASALGGPALNSATFLSPPFFLKPGSVANKYFYGIAFPGGHIALKSFDAEVVDEDGTPVPLYETYLHHWVVARYYGRIEPAGSDDDKLPKRISAGNSGVCGAVLKQYFGLGSETRKTSTWVPDPYGIEVGNPTEIPEGYEEKWLMNVHAIDTRGAYDRLGCTECDCKLYNVSINEFGRPIPANYTGGLYCCYDQTQCQLREGISSSSSRKLFLKYTVTWNDWSDSIVPVKIYIFDVTDTSMLPDAPEDPNFHSSCRVEYQVSECSPYQRANGECTDVKSARMVLPRGGDVIYGVAHQHSGGIGSALYGQDGQLLCASVPTYGEKEVAGNEAGYIVGMSTCYPKPGSIKISDGEILTLVSNYSSTRRHTGVMGLFYILVAEPQQPQLASPECLSFPLLGCVDVRLLLVGVGVAFACLVMAMSYYWRPRSSGYQPLVNG